MYNNNIQEYNLWRNLKSHIKQKALCRVRNILNTYIQFHVIPVRIFPLCISKTTIIKLKQAFVQ